MTKYVTAEWLAEQLRQENGKCSMKLFDIRPIDAHSMRRIRGAAHLQVPNLILRRLRRGPVRLSSLLSSSDSDSRLLLEGHHARNIFTIILYEESPLIQLLVKNFSELGFEAKVLEGSFEDFESAFPDLCESTSKTFSELQVPEDPLKVQLSNLRISCSQPVTPARTLLSPKDESKSPETATPNLTEILPHLFLGDRIDATNLKALQKHSISYILNVTPDLPNLFENDENANIEYMKIPIDDQYSTEISRYFPRTVEFIERARSKSKGVLVHCLAGISRSVTVVVAYLMATENMSLNCAFDHVRKCKANVSPNFNFMGQLLEYEKQLVKEKSYNIQRSLSDTTLSFKTSSEANGTLLPIISARTLEL